jgi:hypothetical protein
MLTTIMMATTIIVIVVITIFESLPYAKYHTLGVSFFGRVSSAERSLYKAASLAEPWNR